MGYSVTPPIYSEKFNYLAVFKNVKYLIWSWSCNIVTHKSTVARIVMCRQDGRGRFPVSLDDHSKCRTNSQRKSQLS